MNAKMIKVLSSEKGQSLLKMSGAVMAVFALVVGVSAGAGTGVSLFDVPMPVS